VGSVVVVVVDELEKERSEVAFTDYHDMIQALLAHGPDDPFGDRIRPG